MRAVVDTNVVAYYLLGTVGFVDETRRFWQSVSEPLAPALWEAEIANVIWMSVRAGVLPEPEAPSKLALAARLGIHSIPTRAIWHGALLRSVRTGVAVYDTLFVELAERERSPLVTFDRRLLTACPDIARTPAQVATG
jgi:predicted nucleic acid-binding protein